MTWAVPAAASFAFMGEAAAAEITGKVIDQEGNPVPNAMIRLDPVPGEWDVTSADDEAGHEVTTKSRESGRYMLKTPRPGKYRLTCGGSSSREIYVGIGVLRENCRR